MRALHWHILLCGALVALVCATAALAAPERLDDVVPDAFPDLPGKFSFGYSHHAIKLEGALNDDSVAHDYFRLRYTFNPKTAFSFRYGSHDLVGGTGLLTPMFNSIDRADSFDFDLNLNLLNVPTTPADPETGEGFAAGSAFGIGFAGTLYQMDMGDLTRDDSLLKAYLVYTTDLSPEMRAHTIFATGRLAGDDQSGSVNTVGAGLDYTLVGGDRPLTLMANGVLDVYNFREPDFNTSRISRFDIGLRYQFAEDWYASAGYTTHNDSENDNSGNGIFASVQFVDNPSPPKEEEECPEEEAPAEGEAAPAEGEATAPTEGEAQAAAPIEPETVPAESQVMASAIYEQPKLMDSIPVLGLPADEPAPAAEGFIQADTGATRQTAGSGEEEDYLDTEQAMEAGEGIVIPPNPVEPPRHTQPGAIMVRAGSGALLRIPHHTRPEDVMLRPPTDPNVDNENGILIAAAYTETPVAVDTDTIEGG